MRKLLILPVALLIIGIWIGFRPHSSGKALAAVSSEPAPAKSGAVACLGRIEPEDGILQVTAPYFAGRAQRVVELKVKDNDVVHAHQLLAVLDGKDQLETALSRAEARVDLARTRLAQVKAGAKPADIAAQKAEIDQLQAKLENAQSEYHRYETLHQTTDVSTAELDARRLAVQTTEHQLEEAQQRLASISEVRATDVDVAEADLRVSQAEVAHARAELASAVVYSPAEGRVLWIHAYPGEEVGPAGLLDLGKTDSMYVVAEVYETDISHVHPGQHSRITSDLFPDTQLTGVVETVGATLAKADVLPLDPVAFADARIFKVRVRLDDGTPVTGLINGKVNVVFQP
jgi:HlyD family secretion protein